jgi:hypothetical protein
MFGGRRAGGLVWSSIPGPPCRRPCLIIYSRAVVPAAAKLEDLSFGVSIFSCGQEGSAFNHYRQKLLQRLQEFSHLFSKHGEQLTDLVIDLRRISQGLRDFLPKYPPIALAEAMHGHLDRPLGDP